MSPIEFCKMVSLLFQRDMKKAWPPFLSEHGCVLSRLESVLPFSEHLESRRKNEFHLLKVAEWRVEKYGSLIR